MRLLDELEWRGLVHQKTADELGDRLEAGPIALYCGFDPTGPSLHVGSLLPILLLKHFQRRGHRVIALTGGATGLIGDPSGKSAERNLLDRAQVEANARRIGGQLLGLLRDDKNPPIHADNIEWLGTMGLLEFLRDVGKHFSINAMVAKDSVRMRLEREGDGISFTEFSYALLQARDFLELHRRHGCELQVGGSDQWGNIVGGVDLIRRAAGGRAFGLTVPLLTDAEGNKFGKTEQGTSCFLDPALTSPYRFYQFWINSDDADVARLLKMFTFLERDRVEALAALAGSPGREAQKALAYEMTAFVHGVAEAEKAIKASEVLFGGDIDGVPVVQLREIFADVPSITMAADRLNGAGASLVDLLVEVGACASKSDARRQLAQGAIRLNGRPVAAAAAGEDLKVTRTAFLEQSVLVIRRGKRNTYLVKLEA
jgi:tyrosyl-tRNA synthetase